MVVPTRGVQFHFFVDPLLCTTRIASNVFDEEAFPRKRTRIAPCFPRKRISLPSVSLALSSPLYRHSLFLSSWFVLLC